MDSGRELVHRRLVEQVALLREHGSDIARGVPDAVHQTRVTCRRLRAVLATFQALLDRAVTDPIRDELRWLAGALSEARDAEVMHERLRGLVAQEPFVEGPVPARLRRTYDARARQGRLDADAAMTSARHHSLLASLEELVADPPWTDHTTEHTAEDARRLVTGRVRAEHRRLARRVAAAYGGQEPDGPAHDRAVHDARKAAKRYRYAWEAAVPVLGPPAEEAVDQAKALTQLLGDRQDSTVTRTHLRQLARDATDAGESAFTYGRLHAREEELARRLDAEFLRRWRESAQKE